jgi:hypothetical protein
MKAVERRKHQMLFDRSKQTNAHERDEDYFAKWINYWECGTNQSLHLTTLFSNYANPGRFYCGYRAHVGMDVRIQDLAFSHNVNQCPSDWDYQM